MSKGDTPRPTNKEKYDEQFESIFGRKEIKTWDPDGEEENENGLHPPDTNGEGSQSGSIQAEGSGERGSNQ